MFNGWEWKFDTEENAKMTNLVLYLAWMLYKDTDSMEGEILETVKKNFSDENDRAAFWLALRADAENYGEEWKTHVDVLLENELDKWYDYSERLTENTKRKLGKYNTRFEEMLLEKNIQGKQLSQKKVFENRVRNLLKEGDYDGAKEIMMPVVEEFRQSNGRSVSAEYIVAFFFASVVRNRGTEHFVEETEQLKFSDKCNWVLRAYAYLEDKEGFADYYWKNRQEIWDKLRYGSWNDEEELYERLQFVLTIGDTALTEDFLKQMCRYFEKVNYVDGVIGHLPLITTWLPFEDIWNRALCIRKIKTYNCDKVYQNLKAYLPREELQDIFLAAAPIDSLLGEHAPLAFFESEYYAWMKETFGDASDAMLSRKFPELYRAEEAHEKWIRDDYHWQMNKRINEIRDCIQLLEGE
jgi:hypothetical protein